MKQETSARIVIDRIEEDLAVLVLYEDDQVKFNLPLRCLPEGVREGDHLQMSFAEDEAGRESEKQRISDLLSEAKNR